MKLEHRIAFAEFLRGLDVDEAALLEVLSRHEKAGGASVPHPRACTCGNPFTDMQLSTCPLALLGTVPALPEE